MCKQIINCQMQTELHFVKIFEQNINIDTDNSENIGNNINLLNFSLLEETKNKNEICCTTPEKIKLSELRSENNLSIINKILLTYWGFSGGW